MSRHCIETLTAEGVENVTRQRRVTGGCFGRSLKFGEIRSSPGRLPRAVEEKPGGARMGAVEITGASRGRIHPNKNPDRRTPDSPRNAPGLLGNGRYQEYG